MAEHDLNVKVSIQPELDSSKLKAQAEEAKAAVSDIGEAAPQSASSTAAPSPARPRVEPATLPTPVATPPPRLNVAPLPVTPTLAAPLPSTSTPTPAAAPPNPAIVEPAAVPSSEVSPSTPAPQPTAIAVTPVTTTPATPTPVAASEPARKPTTEIMDPRSTRAITPARLTLTDPSRDTVVGKETRREMPTPRPAVGLLTPAGRPYQSDEVRQKREEAKVEARAKRIEEQGGGRVSGRQAQEQAREQIKKEGQQTDVSGVAGGASQAISTAASKLGPEALEMSKNFDELHKSMVGLDDKGRQLTDTLQTVPGVSGGAARVLGGGIAGGAAGLAGASIGGRLGNLGGTLGQQQVLGAVGSIAGGTASGAAVGTRVGGVAGGIVGGVIGAVGGIFSAITGGAQRAKEAAEKLKGALEAVREASERTADRLETAERTSVGFRFGEDPTREGLRMFTRVGEVGHAMVERVMARLPSGWGGWTEGARREVAERTVGIERFSSPREGMIRAMHAMSTDLIKMSFGVHGDTREEVMRAATAKIETLIPEGGGLRERLMSAPMEHREGILREELAAERGRVATIEAHGSEAEKSESRLRIEFLEKALERGIAGVTRPDVALRTGVGDSMSFHDTMMASVLERSPAVVVAEESRDLLSRAVELLTDVGTRVAEAVRAAGAGA